MRFGGKWSKYPRLRNASSINRDRRGESRSGDRYVPVRLESGHLTDSRFCLSRMRSRGIRWWRLVVARVKRRAGGLRTNDSSFSSFVPESLQMRYKRGEKWKAREKAAQTLTLSTDPVFDIPVPDLCAFFLQQRIRITRRVRARNYASVSGIVQRWSVNVYAFWNSRWNGLDIDRRWPDIIDWMMLVLNTCDTNNRSGSVFVRDRSDPRTTRFVSSSVFFMHATSCILPGSVSKRTAYKFVGGDYRPSLCLHTRSTRWNEVVQRRVVLSVLSRAINRGEIARGPRNSIK